MKNKIFILPFLIFIFVFSANNVKALTNTDEAFIYKYSSSFEKYYSIYIDRATMKANIYGGTTNLNNPTKTIDLNTYPYLIGWASSYTNYCYSNKPFYYDISSGRFKTGSSFKCSQTNLSEYTANDYNTSASIKSNFDIYNSDGTLYQKATFNMVLIPDIFIELKEDLKDSNDNIIGKVLQTSVSQLDTLKYNYYYRVNDNEWNLIDSTNFVSNSFYYELKENGTYYFKIEDKEDNYVNSSTFTISGIDSFSSLESEEVSYEYTNENNVKTTYNKLLKIPISSFYDFEKGEFKGFQFVFLTKSKTDFSSEFLIEYHNKTNVSGIDIPLQIKFLENLEDFTTINSDTMVGSSGISHSNGGGRHEGVIKECKITKLPYQHNIYNDNTNYYNVLQLIPTNCTNDFNYSLSDFRNDYIYVYYNARVYKDLSSLKEDYKTNNDNYENNSPESFVNSVSQALSYFLKPIKEIFKLVTYFFNSLPFQIRYMFMAVFVIGIILIVFKLFF